MHDRGEPGAVERACAQRDRAAQPFCAEPRAPTRGAAALDHAVRVQQQRVRLPGCDRMHPARRHRGRPQGQIGGEPRRHDPLADEHRRRVTCQAHLDPGTVGRQPHAAGCREHLVVRTLACEHLVEALQRNVGRKAIERVRAPRRSDPRAHCRGGRSVPRHVTDEQGDGGVRQLDAVVEVAAERQTPLARAVVGGDPEAAALDRQRRQQRALQRVRQALHGLARVALGRGRGLRLPPRVLGLGEQACAVEGLRADPRQRLDGCALVGRECALFGKAQRDHADRG